MATEDELRSSAGCLRVSFAQFFSGLPDFNLWILFRNGKSRVGVYCAANFAIEQVVAHEEIDIFNAVKTVRRHRSALIETIVSVFPSPFTKIFNFFCFVNHQMEYKYCYGR